MSKKFIIFLMLWLLLLSFISFSGSFHLSLYGDDWLEISKYFGNFGPGRPMPYSQAYTLFFSNYGPQFLVVAILYSLFGHYAMPYFVLSFIFRLTTVFSVYWFARKISSSKVAVLVSSFFAVSAIGAETTDWVYNMTSYLGIAFVMLGLAYLPEKKLQQRLVSWFFMLLGYVTVIIRVFFLPFMLIAYYFSVDVALNRKISIGSILKGFAAFAPFLLLKVLLPDMGLQRGYLIYVGEGLDIAKTMLQSGRYDFLLYPFVYLGRMSMPYGADLVSRLGVSAYPLPKFLLLSALLLPLGTVLLSWVLTGVRRKVLLSFIVSFIVLFFLKIFIRYQGEWVLKQLDYFIWAYLGFLVAVSLIYRFVVSLIMDKRKEILYWTVATAFSLSFIFPWLYDPRAIFVPEHRYLIVCGIGLMLFWGKILYPQKQFAWIKTIFIAYVFASQIFISRSYFYKQDQARNYNYSENIMSQIQQYVPKIPEGRASAFYITGLTPLQFEEMFRFGFGYNMQLRYNLEFVEENFPYALNTKDDLVKAVTIAEFPGRFAGNISITNINDVYAFKIEGDEVLDITDEIRDELRTQIIK